MGTIEHLQGGAVKNTARIVALACVIALGAAACGNKPDDNAGTTPSSPGEPSTTAPPDNSDVLACMVSDSGGFDDKSFNQTAYKGLTDAVQNLGVSKAQVESQADSDYKNNVNAMIQQHCNIIVTVGFKLGDVTEAAAKKNPNIDFAIVDYGYAKPAPNLKGLGFNTAPTSFLAGYLAAGMTQTGTVGTFGGIKIPTVTIYMDGYWEGVQYYNSQNNTDVKVLGWNEGTQNGSFTNDFEDKNKGAQTASTLTAQGADILFPVAGPAGLGALQVAQNSGGQVNAIWVDTDGCVSAAQYCDVILTSVEKGMDVAVEDAIKATVDGKFNNKPYVGTLANGGTGLAPYHDWASKIPTDLQQQIEQLKQDLMDGTVKVKSQAQP
jgi:basic membrane protein A and related proteins